ncbi:GWxTD domain-containing protein [candidate division KSB1 bacterium]|nr:GWxTD domain-containing protein [candidate division KSB1 bacterium]
MRYDLIVKAAQNGQEAVSERQFVSSWHYLDTSDMSIEHSLEPMKHLVKSREWSWVQEADDSTKDVWFNNFWKQRDPTPDTEENELKDEYYQRVAYVSKNFSVPNFQKAGWDTDRGKIYLKYGAPSNIERRPRSINNPAYEVWSYNSIQRRFIFEDRADFGDFRLVKVE